MATPEILDFERLLAPISAEQPSGYELKKDDERRRVYQDVKDAREAARTAEKMLARARLVGEKTEGLERPDWNKVYDLAVEALATQSKDLWIAAWLIEALCRRHGFAGLRDGFRVTREIVERFWDGIHPMPDEDGYASTVAQLTGLNGDEAEGALIAPIDRIPITAPGSHRALSNADYKQAIELDKVADTDQRAQRVEAGEATLEMFDKAVRETTPDFFRNLKEDVEAAIDEFFKLSEALDGRCGSRPEGGPAAPPSSSIRNCLTEARERIDSLTRGMLEDAAAEQAQEEGGDATAGGGTVSTAGPSKGMSREEAFRQLLRVADFFRRTEPHSPVSYSLEQAVRWGRMSLPELLAELVNDSGVRDELYKRMGITPKEEE